MELATRKKLAESLKGREVRSNPSAHLELRTDGDEIRATGYASVTNTPYDMGAYEESISRGAFAKTLDEKPDVVLLLNHEGLPLSRTTNGTLTLREDERGLPVTPVHFGMRARLRAWRRGFDLRVASCCLEHAGQYFGFCLTEAPGQPAGNPFPG